MDVKIVRLKSGEELIGSITFQNKDEIKIKQACIVLPTGENGQIGLYKFMPYSKTEEFTLKTEDTYFVVEPQDDLESYYLSITQPKSDIIAPENEIVGIK